MTQEIDLKKVKILKLSNGETIIGYINSIEPTSSLIQIEKPFKIMSYYDPEENMSSIFVTRWIELADTNLIGIPADKILTIVIASDVGAREYFNAVLREYKEDDNQDPFLEVVSNNDNPDSSDTDKPNLKLYDFESNTTKH